MIQEQKDLLLKDLCSRLPYGVKISDGEGNIINIVGMYRDAIIIPYAGITKTIQIDSCKPYLFPLSSMTEEQRKEYHKLLYDPENGIGIDYFDWCHKNHFDCRHLIPMGLAEDATGLNIY